MKETLLALGVIVLLLSLCGDSLPAQETERIMKPDAAPAGQKAGQGGSEIPEPDIARIGEGIYRIVFPYKMRTNIAVAITPEGALLVDTGCDKAAIPRLREEIRKLGGEKIAYIVSSHDNWDHVAGNSIAEPGTKLIAFADLRRLADEGLLEVSPGPMKGAAGKTLGMYYTLRVGGEEIRFIPYPGLHTDNDMLTYFPKAGVVHMGDLLLSESFPAVGNAGEYSPFLERVIDVFPLVTQFIPGHGKLLTYRGVREYYYIMRAAEGIVVAALRADDNLDDIISARPLKDFESYNEFMPHLGTESWIRCVHRSDAGADESFPILKGPYLGQNPPGTKAEIFAPGILSRFSMIHGRIIFSPDGYEVFWTNNAAPLQSRWSSKRSPEGAWTRPAASIFSVEYTENSFCYSPDGTALLCQSRRPFEEGAELKDRNIWRRTKSGPGWSDPEPLDPPVNTCEWDEGNPWISADGTLYFTREEASGARGSAGHGTGQNDIYCARLVNGKYEEPVKLGPEINSEHHEIDPVVSPRGDYLVFASNRPGGYGPRLNLWISFRTPEGGWTQAKCLNGLFELENTWFPLLSPDGKYLFFSAGMPTSLGYMDTNYYWVDTACIDTLRPR